MIDGRISNNGKPCSENVFKVGIHNSEVLKVEGNDKEPFSFEYILQKITAFGLPVIEKDPSLLNWLLDYDQNEHILIYSIINSVRICECSMPWVGAPSLEGNKTTLLVGLKNSGKSTLC